jgi:hypothetical protein
MQKRRCVAWLALTGSGLLAACLSAPNEIKTYTPIQLSNPVAVVRDNEPIIIPLSEVKSRYPNFDVNDFSVNLMASNWNPRDYDPMLATDPPPVIPAQLFDTNRDGQPDALLVICDVGPHERRILSVCTPRFSKLSKAIGPHEGGGLYVRGDTHREAASSVGGRLRAGRVRGARPGPPRAATTSTSAADRSSRPTRAAGASSSTPASAST